MENFPESRFDRRRFLKSGISQINRTGLSQAFAQKTWGDDRSNTAGRRQAASKPSNGESNRVPRIRLT